MQASKVAANRPSDDQPFRSSFYPALDRVATASAAARSATMALQAARAVDPFHEHVQFMQALYQQYQKKDEADSVALVESMLAEAQAGCSQREASLKDVIRGECRANGPTGRRCQGSAWGWHGQHD